MAPKETRATSDYHSLILQKDVIATPLAHTLQTVS